jgi:hypothetical protein
MSAKKIIRGPAGLLFSGYQLNIETTVKIAALRHPRLFAVRVDLRLPREAALLIKAQTDSAVITRFIESLKAQIKADLNRKAKAGKRVHPCELFYAWAREFGAKLHHRHYHALLLFNKDTYAFLGDYEKDEGTLKSIITKAWVRALRLHYPEGKGLAHMVEGGTRYLNGHKGQLDLELRAVLELGDYLAKVATKQSDGMRNFGCSLDTQNRNRRSK